MQPASGPTPSTQRIIPISIMATLKIRPSSDGPLVANKMAILRPLLPMLARPFTIHEMSIKHVFGGDFMEVFGEILGKILDLKQSGHHQTAP